MKLGVREICDVVLRAKATQKVGNKLFYKNEPVIYFDTLKTSSMEGAATTVYAQGGRGNARLIAWEGERTITFTMEDALISPEGFMILSGAGLIDAAEGSTVKQHVTETIDKKDIIVQPASKGPDSVANSIVVTVSKKPYFSAEEKDSYAFVMFVKEGEIITEPYVVDYNTQATPEKDGRFKMTVKDANGYTIKNLPEDYDSAIVDYYTEHGKGAQQIEITADKFGGNYYLEASTLFRDERGVDMPAEFIIPNCKIQSNFTFTMASSGDPSTFTFTMDAFPDFTRFDHSKKVLAAIQIIKDEDKLSKSRTQTDHLVDDEKGI